MLKRNALEDRLYQRGRIWWFWAWDYAGKRYADTTHQSDKKAALAYARVEERRRAVPPDPNAAKPEALGLTLGQAIKLLRADDIRNGASKSTLTVHANRGRHLVAYFGQDRCVAPGQFELTDSNAYTDHRLAEPKRPHPDADIKRRNSIAQEFTTLIHALRVAKANGLYDADPGRLRPQAFRKQARFYKPGDGWLRTAQQCDALVAHVCRSRTDKPRIDRRLHVLAYLHTGVRRNELGLIKPEHVHLDAGHVYIAGTKTTGAKRNVSLSPTAREVFARALKGAKRGQPVFAPWPGINRELREGWRDARAWLTETAGEDSVAGTPIDLKPNDLRRTFCSMLAAAGVPLHVCADLMGHKSLTMIMQVYRQVCPSANADAVAKLPALTLPTIDLPTGTVTDSVTNQLRETVSAAHDNRRKNAAKLDKNRKTPVNRG